MGSRALRSRRFDRRLSADAPLIEVRKRDYPKLSKGRLSVAALGALLILLLPPSFALHRLAAVVDWRIIAGYCALLFATTFLYYRHDKRQAEGGGRRTPESTLHLCEVMGGWPAAFVAQRMLRHKITKRGYQVAFWIIVLTEEYFTVDFLQGWRWTLQAVLLLERASASALS